MGGYYRDIRYISFVLVQTLSMEQRRPIDRTIDGRWIESRKKKKGKKRKSNIATIDQRYDENSSKNHGHRLNDRGEHGYHMSGHGEYYISEDYRWTRSYRRRICLRSTTTPIYPSLIALMDKDNKIRIETGQNFARKEQRKERERERKTRFERSIDEQRRERKRGDYKMRWVAL